MIILMGGLLRGWGIAYDLPFVYHPDEPVYISISQGIFQKGDLNPHFFNYPSLFFYLHALAYVPYYLVGRYFGRFASPESIPAPVVLTMGVAKSPMPTTVLMGRIITLGFGIGCVALAFLVARALTYRDSVGLLGAALVATSPIHVWHNRFITPDTQVTFFALASLLASVFVLREGKVWQYALAGVCIGLTASSKYNGVLVVSTFLAAHFLRTGVGGVQNPSLYLGLLLSGLTFVATTPFAILDYSIFIEHVRFEAEHYLNGHPGMEGDTLRWYAEYLWMSMGPVCLLAVVEMARGALRRSRETALVAVFPVTYFVFINRFTVRNARTILPLTPYLFLLAACFLVRASRRSSVLERRGVDHIKRASVLGLTTLSLALPFVRTVRASQRLCEPDNREMARQWVADHLAPGTKVAVESYGPFVDPESHSVLGVVRIIDHDLRWYVENDFEYVVFSEGMYGRYYRDREDYAVEASQYDAFFSQLVLVREFGADHDTIRICRLDG